MSEGGPIDDDHGRALSAPRLRCHAESVDARVRPAEVGDVDALARVHLESWRRSYRGLLPESFLSSLRHERLAASFWRRLATDEIDECIRVLEIDGRVGGFVRPGGAKRQ